MRFIVSLIILATCAIIFICAIFLKRKALATSLAPTRTQAPPAAANPTAPTAGTPSTKKKWAEYLRNPLKSKFAPIIIAVTAGLWFFSYQGQDTVKKDRKSVV